MENNWGKSVRILVNEIDLAVKKKVLFEHREVELVMIFENSQTP